jgi:hypothetical protein
MHIVTLHIECTLGKLAVTIEDEQARPYTVANCRTPETAALAALALSLAPPHTSCRSLYTTPRTVPHCRAETSGLPQAGTTCFYYQIQHTFTTRYNMLLLPDTTYFYYPIQHTFTTRYNILLLPDTTYFYYPIQHTFTTRYNILLLPDTTYFYYPIQHTFTTRYNILLLPDTTYFYYQIQHTFTTRYNILLLPNLHCMPFSRK